jgi:DNA-binding ferritin-like protein
VAKKKKTKKPKPRNPVAVAMAKRYAGTGAAGQHQPSKKSRHRVERRKSKQRGYADENPSLRLLDTVIREDGRHRHLLDRVSERLVPASNKKKRRFILVHRLFRECYNLRHKSLGGALLNGQVAVQFGGEPGGRGDYLIATFENGFYRNPVTVLVDMEPMNTPVVQGKRLVQNAVSHCRAFPEMPKWNPRMSDDEFSRRQARWTAESLANLVENWDRIGERSYPGPELRAVLCRYPHDWGREDFEEEALHVRGLAARPNSGLLPGSVEFVFQRSAGWPRFAFPGAADPNAITRREAGPNELAIRVNRDLLTREEYHYIARQLRAHPGLVGTTYYRPDGSYRSYDEIREEQEARGQAMPGFRKRGKHPSKPKGKRPISSRERKLLARPNSEVKPVTGYKVCPVHGTKSTPWKQFGPMGFGYYGAYKCWECNEQQEKEFEARRKEARRLARRLVESHYSGEFFDDEDDEGWLLNNPRHPDVEMYQNPSLRTSRQRKKMMRGVTIYHADHGISKKQKEFIVSTLRRSAPQGFFIQQVTIPRGLGSVPNALYGPDAGDLPVREEEVYYASRGGRPVQDRLVHAAPRPWSYVQTIGVRDGDDFTIFTIYGGPLAPMHPDDPNNRDPEGSREWWSQHALADGQWSASRSNPRQSDVKMYQNILAQMRALQWVYTTSHWTSSGPNSYSDHLLLQRLYEGLEKPIDALGERMVAYFGPQSVDPDLINKRVQAIIFEKGRTGGGIGRKKIQPGEELWALLRTEQDLQKAIRKAWRANQDSGDEFSLGIDDYLMGLANERDEAIYLLKQRLRP